MSNVLIGVGGSGQHVVHAYLRVLSLSNCRPQDVPHVYIVDADASVQTGAKGDSQLCANIRQLHTQLVKSLAGEARAHFALIRPYFQQNAESTPGKTEDSLALNTCPSWLTDIFLTDEAATAHASAGDRSVQLLQGMMANAKVGAMSFGFKLMKSQAESDAVKAVNFGFTDRELGESFSLLRDVKNANVAIVGSTFGGTGSGVIPALVRHLSAISAGGPKFIRAFMTLPWFEIDSGDGTSAAATIGNLDPKARNAALGLRTYLNELSNGLPRSNYLVAQFPGDLATREDRGNYNQGENPHVFNIILATSIQQFLWTQNDNGAISGGGTKRKLLSLITTRDEETRGEFDAAQSSHLRFRVGQDNNVSLLDITLEAEVLALALEKGADYIRNAEFKVIGADTRDEPEALRELAKLIATSYDKKPLTKRGMIGLRKDVAPNEVYNSLAGALQSVAATVRDSLLWLDAHRVTSDNPQGAKFPNISHLFNLSKDNAYSPATEEDLKARWLAYGLDKLSNKQNKGQLLKDNTARISQAFTLFINVFSTDVQLSQELKSLADNQPDAPIYAVAARMLSALVYQEVIEARSARRNVAYAGDKQDDAPPTEGQTTAFFKSFKIEIDAETSRTCKIAQGALDATLGDAGKDNFQSPISDSHPLSLRYIDPYVGIGNEQVVDLATVSKLASGEKYFAESALRGIPNVIAPIILHDWRLARKSGHAEPPLLTTPGVRDLRLSEAGLFQHAARVVEAGFWLLFSQDPRVELVQLQDNEVEEALTSSKFAALVNEELRTYAQQTNRAASSNALPRTFIAFRRPEENKRSSPIKPILIHDPRTGWYLAANSAARKFFTELMPTLPSVRYGSSTLDAAWRGDRPDAKPSVAAGTFEANTVAAFLTYLNGITKSFGQGNNEVDWIKALRFIEFVLNKQFQRSNNAENEIELSITKNLTVLNSAGNEATLPLRTPKALMAMSSDMFVADPVYFFVGDERRSPEWGGVWPLKGAAWEHLEAITKSATKLSNPMEMRLLRDADIASDTRSAWYAQSITLNLRQLGTRKILNPFDKAGERTELPGCTDFDQWVGAVWPKFEAPDWHYYIAGGGYFAKLPTLLDFDLRQNQLKVQDVELHYYGEPYPVANDGSTQEELGKFGCIGIVKYLMPIKLTGRPRAVELVVNGRILGSIPIYLKPPPNAQQTANCELAMDFGTSNTCMAMKMDGETEPKHLPLLPGERVLSGDKPIPSLTRVLGVNPMPGSGLSAAGSRIEKSPTPIFFFQSFAKTGSEGVPSSIPSELLGLRSFSIYEQGAYLEREKNNLLDTHSIAPGSDFSVAPTLLKQAVVTPHFTPLPPAIGVLPKYFNAFLQGGLFQNFKWPTDAIEPGVNLGFRAVYIEQILVAAMATLRWMGVRNASRFVATYPGAFSPDYRDLYIQHLRKILSSISKQTGIKFRDNEPVQRRSETIAALAATNPNDQQICVTIDMGGGTTDVGIIVPEMLGADKPFAYMSSIKYAGNNLLKALLQVPKLKELSSDWGQDDAARLNCLRLSIRTADENLKEPSVAGVATAFFEGLYEYVFTLLSAISSDPKFPKDLPINVRLFGNGFKLTNVFIGRDAESFFRTITAQVGGAGLLSEDVLKRVRLVASSNDTKLALIQGALKIKPGRSRIEDMLLEIDENGHGRVALWYPCVKRNGVAAGAITLGSAEERNKIADDDPAAINALRIDMRDVETLKKTFPLTSKYWDQANAIDPIFNNVPQKQLIALGQYYLEGTSSVASSFAEIVLPDLAKRSRASQKDTQSL
jgi:hypothetical protein